MNKFRGVNKINTGGYTVTLAQKYLGHFCSFDDAVNARKAAEIEKYGHLLEKREIEIDGDIAKVPLYGRGTHLYGWAVIDLQDLDKVKGTAWTLSKTGYAVGRPSGSKNAIKMHRYILLGLDSGKIVDHIDRNPLNNRRENLRICTTLGNARNTKISKNNTSGFKGVRKTKNNTWKARITVNWKEIHLGHFKTKEEAAIAYNNAAIKYHGEFASLNVI